jgi:hypothetical protein
MFLSELATFCNFFATSAVYHENITLVQRSNDRVAIHRDCQGGIEMVRKCQVCGANLSLYNSGQMCSPCVKKKKEIIEEKFLYSEGNRIDHIYDLLQQKGQRGLNLVFAKERAR